MDRRIERTIAKAREAALDVLADRGFAAFTMEAVGERSGIAKSTLYRHWPDRMALLADALETLNVQPKPREPIGEGAFRDRVIALVGHLASVFEGSRVARVMPALVDAATHHPEVRDFLHAYSAARRRTLVDLLARGVASGELAADLDPDLAALALSSPVFYCRFLTPAPFPAAHVSQLVDLVLRA
ncbi:TetR/AcrR family transcriptional regulator [Sphingosinicella terrae]|uniref:TetR/AcrR family transcriptional regulator n=1 Tax=Sphingosinicella terrae TaxID=2172047 RepID=UPI000E0E054C|nr:TetR/AcrR family transcriptional regulator [Sphingosinicella terrae]